VAGHVHELTFSCYRRKPLLTNDPWREKLARGIDDGWDENGFSLNAFVFMPEHVHLLVLPDDEHSEVSQLLARIKQPFSNQIVSFRQACLSSSAASASVVVFHDHVLEDSGCVTASTLSRLRDWRSSRSALHPGASIVSAASEFPNRFGGRLRS
jgi:putative transposase